MNGNIKKTLTLSLKKQWFEMTKAGIKTEDYREINPYWIKRLLDISKCHYKLEKKSFSDIANDFDEIIEAGWDIDEAVNYILKNNGFSFKLFKNNIMTLGYPKSGDTERILKLEHKGIEIRTGNPEWGAEHNKLYFVILHGSLVE